MATATNHENLQGKLARQGKALNTLNPWKRLRLDTRHKPVEFPRIHEVTGEHLKSTVTRRTRCKRISQTAFSYTSDGELVLSERKLDGSVIHKIVSIREISSREAAYLLKNL